MTGIDPSAESVATARAHAESEGLEIEYTVGAGEQLPFPDESFDIAYCCDVLEHVDDLDRVLAETSRVLKPGGIYLYDTINRTRRSKLVVINLMQEWRSTALMEPNLHDWDMFIKPSELTAAMARGRAREPRRRGDRPRTEPGVAGDRHAPPRTRRHDVRGVRSAQQVPGDSGQVASVCRSCPEAAVTATAEPAARAGNRAGVDPPALGVGG